MRDGCQFNSILLLLSKMCIKRNNKGYIYVSRYPINQTEEQNEPPQVIHRHHSLVCHPCMKTVALVICAVCGTCRILIIRHKRKKLSDTQFLLNFSTMST